MLLAALAQKPLEHPLALSFSVLVPLGAMREVKSLIFRGLLQQPSLALPGLKHRSP